MVRGAAGLQLYGVSSYYLLGKDIEDLEGIVDADKLYDIKDANDIIRRNCTILHTQINDIIIG